MQKKALRSSSDGQSDEINAKLEAAEPVWRAKGESLRAEVSLPSPSDPLSHPSPPRVGCSFVSMEIHTVYFVFRTYPGRCTVQVT